MYPSRCEPRSVGIPERYHIVPRQTVFYADILQASTRYLEIYYDISGVAAFPHGSTHVREWSVRQTTCILTAASSLDMHCEEVRETRGFTGRHRFLYCAVSNDVSRQECLL